MYMYMYIVFQFCCTAHSTLCITLYLHLNCLNDTMIHDVIRDVERKKERHLRQMEK